MLHTHLHRALGENPGPLTDQMIDAAVASALIHRWCFQGWLVSGWVCRSRSRTRR